MWIAKLSTKLAILSIGEIKFSWLNFNKSQLSDEAMSVGTRLETQ
jgi:hypothetical protein